MLDITLTPRDLLSEVVLGAVSMRWCNAGSSEQGERKLNSKLTTLEFRTADFGLFKDLLGRVLWNKILQG